MPHLNRTIPRTRTDSRSRTHSRTRIRTRVHARRLGRITTAAATAGIAVAALTGCATLDAVATLGNPVGRGLYETAATFEQTETAKALDSGWLPDDAARVRLTYRHDGSAALLMFTTAQSLDTLCAPANTVPVPALEDSWWPQTVPETAYLCGDRWTAFADGGTVYAFTGTDTSAAASVTPVDGTAETTRSPGY